MHYITMNKGNGIEFFPALENIIYIYIYIYIFFFFFNLHAFPQSGNNVRLTNLLANKSTCQT